MAKWEKIEKTSIFKGTQDNNNNNMKKKQTHKKETIIY